MRRKPARKSARTYLAGLYSRLSKTASAGLRRLRGRANRAGSGHIAEDLAEFDYIEREAHDILAAVARLRARDLGETMAGPAYLPEPSYSMEPAGMLEPMPETLMEYAPETTANQARGRRRRNAAGRRGRR